MWVRNLYTLPIADFLEQAQVDHDGFEDNLKKFSDDVETAAGIMADNWGQHDAMTKNPHCDVFWDWGELPPPVPWGG